MSQFYVEKDCPKCGYRSRGMTVCPNCRANLSGVQGVQYQGTHQGVTYTPPQTITRPAGHSIGLAILFSFLIFGGGQLYNGQWQKALAYFFGGAAISVLTLFFAMPLIWAANMVDAGIFADRLSKGQTISLWY